MGTKLHEARSNGQHYSWLFFCPGCDDVHQVTSGWSWNGDKELPTFSPSILVTYAHGERQVTDRCHSFVRSGKIEFLGDCTHSLVGQTVELPDWPHPHWK